MRTNMVIADPINILLTNFGRCIIFLIVECALFTNRFSFISELHELNESGQSHEVKLCAGNAARAAMHAGIAN